MLNALAHLFLPRKSNNHKAKLIHSSSLILIVIVIILSQIGFEIVNKKGGQILGYAANISNSEVERLTNAQREANGLSSLKDNPILDQAALAKGKDMLAKGYWAHVAPDGTQPWAFFISNGYSYQYAGENLARDFPDASSAVNAWMASPSHKENILSPNYKEMGIGVVEGNLAGVDTTIIVQFFGTKLGDPLPIQPVAKASAKTPAPVVSPTPVATPTLAPVIAQINPTPKPPSALIASSKITPFEITRYLSLGLVAVLITVVAVDGFLINKRKIFRIAGHFPAHIAFLGMILTIVIIAKAGRII